MLVAFIAAAVAQAPAPPAPSASAELERNRLAITETAPGTFAGAGWDRLIADGAASHFFMVGEQHGVADIIRFAAAAQRTLATRGYTHGAIEVGPWSTDRAETLIRSGPGKLKAYLSRKDRALNMPFLFQQEEVDLAEQIVRLSPDKVDAVWGLDQEFVRGGGVVSDVLADMARTAAERAAIEAFRQKLAANPDLIGVARWSELAALEAAFARNPKARELVAALKLSNEIYAPFVGRGGFGYDGNLRRETLLKANFVRAYTASERRNGVPPKVFLKFGGFHGQRGFTGTNVPGFGNFLYEWGQARGFGFTNVMVDCAGGDANNPIRGASTPCEPYFSADTLFAKMAKPDRLTLVDLRPMRRLLQRMTGLDEASRRLILSYDYYLVIKDVRPATPTAPPGS